jgi:hypothetical protein
MERGPEGDPLNTLETLQKQYRDYLDLIKGNCDLLESPLCPMFQGSENALPQYRTDYLNDQIVNWGGVVEEIFFETCKELKGEKIEMNEFVSFFHQTLLPPKTEFDFFKIKLDRFKEFVYEISQFVEPAKKAKLRSVAEQEFKACFEAYRSFNPLD